MDGRALQDRHYSLYSGAHQPHEVIEERGIAPAAAADGRVDAHEKACRLRGGEQAAADGRAL
jgi:hypothetical protein